MTKHKLTIITTAALLAACSSPPRVATPSGDHRVPINKTDPVVSYYAAYPPVQVFPTTPQQIPQPAHPPIQTPSYKSSSKSTTANTPSSSEVETTIADLKKQIASLKSQIAQQKTPSEAVTAPAIKSSAGKAEINKTSIPPEAPITTAKSAPPNQAYSRSTSTVAPNTSSASTPPVASSLTTSTAATQTSTPLTVWALPSTPPPAAPTSSTPSQSLSQATKQTHPVPSTAEKASTATVTTSAPPKPGSSKTGAALTASQNTSALVAEAKSTAKETASTMKAIAEKPAAPINKRLAKLLKDPKKQVVMHDESVTFTVNHEPGQSTFHIPKEMKTVLLDLAKTSQTIEVRGYTDTDKDDEKNNEVALSRAVAAYDFLVQNGVTPNQIYVSYENAGYFTAENNTSKGKARNRRVEIEVIGSDTTYLR